MNKKVTFLNHSDVIQGSKDERISRILNMAGERATLDDAGVRRERQHDIKLELIGELAR